jgi:RNA polymerase sigma-70 factor (ECF subfamily)
VSDGSELDAWVLATAPAAVAYAASLLHQRAAAEDIVQDCYCRLLARADTYDLPRDGRKLLFQAVTNACLNRLSRERPALSLFTGDDGPQTQLADRGAEPAERVLMRRELEDAIADGLARLPPTQRAALELKGLNHSLDDIATALNVSPSNAGVLIHRARQAMAKYLAPHLEERSG